MCLSHTEAFNIIVCILCLRSKRLSNIITAMSPAILRIGGTTADQTFFSASPNVTKVSMTLKPQILTGKFQESALYAYKTSIHVVRKLFLFIHIAVTLNIFKNCC